MRYFEKESAVLGIPDRAVFGTPPPLSTVQKWQLSIQKHDVKSGTHYDLRLAPPGGAALSWAGRYLPAPGGKELFVQQADHSPEYMDFSGKIEKGYGVGSVSVERRGEVEVLNSSPDKITFYFYPGHGVEKYTLLRMSGKEWLFINHTVSKEHEDLIPVPLKYKDKYVEREGDIKTPKIDGASSVLILRPDKTPAVFSKRTSKRNNQRIEYTPKLPQLLNVRSPKSLGTTVLRAEVYGLTPDNKELPNRILGGILNSGVWKSRELQQQLGANLRLAAFDVVRYQGKDVSTLPYEKKLLLIKQIRSNFPYIDIPSEVGQTVDFKEGKVIWQSGVPYRVKNKQDYDVYVRNIFPSTHEGRAGGFDYSFTPRGPIAGRVGTGFTHLELKDMYKNPNKYKGMVARVESQQQHPSGALRAPAFKDWHLDKNI